MSDDGEGKLYCKIALEEAFGLCGEPEDAFQEMAYFLGFTEEEIGEIFPIGKKYERILSEGLRDHDCTGPGVRVWVLARAWEIYIKDGETIKNAITRAWREARDDCAERGLWMGIL